MYRRLAQLEKLVENDNSSSRRPRCDIFFGLDDGKCKANPNAFCEGSPLWCAFMSTTALPVIQDEKKSDAASETESYRSPLVFRAERASGTFF